MEAGEEKGSTNCGNRQEVVIADLCPFGFIGKSKPLELLYAGKVSKDLRMRLLRICSKR